MLISPGPGGFFGESLALYNRRTKQSLSCPYSGLRIPLVRRGLRSALIRHISSHDKMSRVVIIFFSEKATKNHVVNRDKKITIRDKITNRFFFLR